MSNVSEHTDALYSSVSLNTPWNVWRARWILQRTDVYTRNSWLFLVTSVSVSRFEGKFAARYYLSVFVLSTWCQMFPSILTLRIPAFPCILLETFKPRRPFSKVSYFPCLSELQLGSAAKGEWSLKPHAVYHSKQVVSYLRSSDLSVIAN